MSKSPLDQREHDLIDKMPNKTQRTYGFADSHEINWNLKDTTFDKAFDAIYNWGYKESDIKTYLYNEMPLTPTLKDKDKAKAVKFSAK